MSTRRDYQVFRLLLIRDLKETYANTTLGFVWALLLPLAVLAIYAFVFTRVLQVRLPDAVGAGFVAYLAVALWPWTAFADGLMRATSSIVDAANLIGKVQMPLYVVVLSKLTAVFLLAMLGYVLVLLVLALTGTPVSLLGLPVAIGTVLLIFLFTASLGLIAAITQVYFPDLRHALPAFIMLGFFLTPILYSIQMVPDRFQVIYRFNPLAYLFERLREVLLTDRWQPVAGDGIALIGVVLLLILALKYFQRLRPRVEEYL
ncbi:MAG: ABC transporter permease [Lysobacterales bacterium]